MAKTICIGAMRDTYRPYKVQYYLVPEFAARGIRECTKMLARFDELVVYVGNFGGDAKMRQVFIASGTKRSGTHDVIETRIGIFPRAEAWRVFRAHVRML